MCKATVEQLPCCLEMPWNHSTSANTRLLISCIYPKPSQHQQWPIKGNTYPHKQHIRFLRRNAYKGPVLSLSSNPSFTRPSTPMPVTDEFSSLAMNTAMTECFKGGLTSPSRRISWATSATCPRQSVVPRPRSLSLSSLSKVSEKGSKSCRNVDKQRSLMRIKYFIGEQRWLQKYNRLKRWRFLQAAHMNQKIKQI